MASNYNATASEEGDLHQLAIPIEKQPTARGPLISQISGFFGLARSETLNKQKERPPNNVALKAFPLEVQSILAPFDRDHDGLLDANELEEAAKAFLESKQTVKKLTRAFFVILFTLLILCGALGGIVFAVVTLTEQLAVSNGDVLTAKGSTTPIKVSATSVFQTSTLSSNMDQDVFNNMRFLQITSPTGAELNLQVTGTARLPVKLPPYGSVVQIYLGELGYARLNADVIEFSTGVDTLFDAAGLQTIATPSGSGRRLLQSNGFGINGVFNALHKPASPAVYQSPPPRPAVPAQSSTNTIVATLKPGKTAFTCPILKNLVAHSKGVATNVGVFTIPSNSPQAINNLITLVQNNCPEVDSVAADEELEIAGFKVEPMHSSPLFDRADGHGRRSLQQAALSSVPTPNDPRYSDPGLWGQDYMNILEAWSLTEGRAAVTVCVTDTGVDDTHEDLTTTLFTNVHEIPGNGIDDDASGVIDDVHGAQMISAANIKNGNITDQNGHGTHVTGILGATLNNLLGVAGIAPNVKVLMCKNAGANGASTYGDTVNCFNYCYKRGARIFSTSEGSCTTSSSATTVMKNVMASMPDAMFFFSAGNNGKKIPSTDGCGFPGRIALANVMNVGSVNWNYARSSFSNYGPTLIELGAPGEYILSTSNKGSYVVMSGTSMAAPAAAGVAALLKSAFPTMTIAQMRQTLLKNCDSITQGSLLFECGGMINAARAMTYARDVLLIPLAPNSTR